ncbi:hypothetical protein QTP70_002567 [Hemibagrus guttatus]|uniref:CCHC-type domain-containing protein n=1 Tax=Hemibagrus guttatus TaxID=175788 RepID=A0AAE0UZP6_9TELE|nr:hypothetical protein QTP70_002567 [Hemibagrus guttatus]
MARSLCSNSSQRESAHNCARSLSHKELFGRTVKASIAIDNGRAAEFIRRRNYTDKSKCYECGEDGHLSYACPKNLLGEREPPPKKEKKKKKKMKHLDEVEPEEIEDEGEDPALDSLSQAIAFQQARMEEEERRRKQTTADLSHTSTSDSSHKPRIKKSAYFSDEEELNLGSEFLFKP